MCIQKNRVIKLSQNVWRFVVARLAAFIDYLLLGMYNIHYIHIQYVHVQYVHVQYICTLYILEWTKYVQYTVYENKYLWNFIFFFYLNKTEQNIYTKNTFNFHLIYPYVLYLVDCFASFTVSSDYPFKISSFFLRILFCTSSHQKYIRAQPFYRF